MTASTPPPFPSTEPPRPGSDAPPVPYGAVTSEPAPTPETPATPVAPQSAVPAYGYAPSGQPAPGAEVGKIRSTGVCILLSIVTFGIYTAVYYFKVHDEMKRHSGQGVGGGVALLLALFVGVAMPFVTASEVGGLYERRGQARPVSAATGLWAFPGFLILVGPIVWFVKTNGALNSYWRSVGAAA